MPKRQLLHVGIGLLLSAALAHCQQLTVETEGGKQKVLAKSDIESLPHLKITTHDSEKPVTFEGVALKTVLEEAGLEFGHSMRGNRLASCLLVEAADGYRAVIAIPETDPDFTDRQIVLAFLKDGNRLDAKEGAYRIVIPDEKRMARWVGQVTKLKIVKCALGVNLSESSPPLPYQPQPPCLLWGFDSSALRRALALSMRLSRHTYSRMRRDITQLDFLDFFTKLVSG
jgi:hypothetical protein